MKAYFVEKDMDVDEVTFMYDNATQRHRGKEKSIERGVGKKFEGGAPFGETAVSRSAYYQSRG